MEQDIKILEELKNIFLSLKYHGYINDVKKDISTDGVINAIENILKERQQDKEKIKELEKENKKLKRLIPYGFYPDINTDYLKKFKKE